MAKRRLLFGQGAKRGDEIGPNPTDRAKKGSKRGLLTDGDGGPLSIFVAPANRHDSLLLQDVLERVVTEPPNPHEHRQHLCLDKAFDGGPSRATAMVFGYVPHVRRIGEEKLDGQGEKRHPARRWVVERCFAWLNNCRSILVRWAKRSSNYLGLIKLASILLWYRRLKRLPTK
jgi:putative transposase